MEQAKEVVAAAQELQSSLTEVATPEEGYALGGRFILHSEADDRLISWQTGSNGAYKSLVTYDPVSDVGFAAMTASGDATDIAANPTRFIWTSRNRVNTRFIFRCVRTVSNSTSG